MTRLGPGDVPQNQPVRVIHGEEGGFTDDAELPDAVVQEMTAGLQELRAPFPPDMIEKLPKPLWRGAWDGMSKGHCRECHGYHPLENTIHLDYVGHANATNRLLEVDPFWEWEPMAYTEAGLPLFDKVGGLWIRLTVCGVTRLGYGDGASPKEIIGDAIRNAAMRFGVALDLWAKIDLHAERNPGDGQASTRRDGAQSDQRQRPESNQATSSAHSGEQDAPADEPPRAPNQDALDSLGSVCDENGYDRRTMRDAYASWAKSKRYKERDLLVADPDRILAFAAKLIEDATPDPDGDDSEQPAPGPASPDTADEAQAGDPFPDRSDGGAAVVDREAVSTPGEDVAQAEVGNPEDTSDVEKSDDEPF